VVARLTNGRGIVKIIVWVCLIAFGLTAAAAGQSYSVTDLGTLGGASSGALAINDVGQIAGISSLSDGDDRAFVWSKTQGMKDLGLLHAGDLTSTASGINDAGQVVGTSGGYAFLWTKSGGMQDLGNLGGTGVNAYGINSLGDVVGDSYLSDGSQQHAFLWTQASGMQDLGTLGGIASVAYAINDSEEIVGFSFLSDNVTEHAFLWTAADGMQDLGTLGGQSSVAYGINLLGEVVGIADNTSTSSVAFTWTQAGGMRPMNLGNTIAFGVNNNGQAVGTWTPSAPKGCGISIRSSPMGLASRWRTASIRLAR
jgi:probable HAF family extracellular repeat protein